jgi:hypothetical protein
VTGFDYFGDAQYQALLARAAGTARAARHGGWDYVGLEPARSPLDLRLLGLLGVTLVATPPTDVVTAAGGYTDIGELTDGRRVVQTFVARWNGLRRIDLLAATHARRNDGLLEIALYDDDEGDRLVWEWRFAAADLRDLDWLALEFPPQPQSGGRRHRLEIRAQDARPGRAVTLLASPANGLAPGALVLDGRPDARALRLRAFSTAPERFPGATLLFARDLNVYRNPFAQPCAWFARGARVLPAAQHPGALAEPGWDPGVAIVDRDVGQPSAGATVTRIDSTEPDRRVVAVHAPSGGVVVFTERFDPRWSLRADGHQVELVRANAVLMAAAVPPGTRELVLEYSRPDWAAALLISALALAGIVVASKAAS